VSAVRYATPSDTPTMTAEKRCRDFQPFLRRSVYIDKLARKLQEARAEREAAATELLTRLGLTTVHPLIEGFQALDLLSAVEVEDGHWIWTGVFNKHGSPVTYPHVGRKRTYFGASKMVHLAVTGCQHQGAYHPRCGERRCVLPAHRCKTCAPSSAAVAPAARMALTSDRGTFSTGPGTATRPGPVGHSSGESSATPPSPQPRASSGLAGPSNH
jgi:hypothetical protein